ncbi:MAG: hypothetical protein U1F17_08215 [Burkholderiaceae bacterium]
MPVSEAMRDRAVAVVVGQDINALGVLRSLAAGGVACYALVSDRSSPVGWSRFGIKTPCAALAGTELVQALRSFADRFPDGDRPVLFLTEEKGVDTVCEHLPEIKCRYRYTAPDAGVLRALLRKNEFQQMAERSGASIPRSLHLSSATLPEAARTLAFPVILKPTVRDYEYAKHFAKAYKCASLEELAGWVERIMPTCNDLMVQEWIEGDDSDIYFCLTYCARDPGDRIAFVGRKLRSWPPRIGGTASCVAAPEFHDELSRRTFAFFDAVGFLGVGSMEFKRDRRDGEFYMVEPTVGRTDFQQEVATVNGANIPLRVFDAELGLRGEPPRYADPPVVWYDAQSVRQARAREERAGIDLVEAPAVDALFRWNDPLPALHARMRPFMARLRGIGRRLGVGPQG